MFKKQKPKTKENPLQRELKGARRVVGDIQLSRQREGPAARRVKKPQVDGFVQNSRLGDSHMEHDGIPEVLKKRQPGIMTPAIRKRSSVSSYVKRVLVGVTIIGLVVLGGYFVISRQVLRVVVVPKKLTYDLSNGVQMLMPGEILSTSLLKKVERNSSVMSDVKVKAKGTIIVYNSFSSKKQTLRIETRFETPNGLIFYSQKRISVPGMKKENGQTTPGSIEVNVVAAEPGEKYNIGLTDFTIPGFSGSPKFKGFYARSKTEMTGGAIGQAKIVDEKGAQEILDGLENELRSEIVEKLAGLAGKEQIIFPGAIDITILSRITDPEAGSKADSFFAEVRGEARVLALDKKLFQTKLTQNLFADSYEESRFVFSNESDIKLLKAKNNFDDKELSLTVVGKAVFKWIIDPKAIREKVAALQDSLMLESVFVNYRPVDRAEFSFSPRWPRRIPGNIDRIVVELRDTE